MSEFKRSAVKLQQDSGPVLLNPETCFDEMVFEDERSAGDRFRLRQQDFARLATPELLNEHPTLPGLCLLGSVSAVESYVREVIRRVLEFDKEARLGAMEYELSLGAAVALEKHMLPEAVLEKFSFANSDNIDNALKKMLGVKGQRPNVVKEVFARYDTVCQLRHCWVHRSGYLGAQNAISIDFEVLSKFIECPMELGFGQIQAVFGTNDNLVRVLNDFLFNYLVSRVAARHEWTWDLRRDKPLFKRYWGVFHSSQDAHAMAESLKQVYDQIREELGQ